MASSLWAGSLLSLLGFLNPKSGNRAVASRGLMGPEISTEQLWVERLLLRAQGRGATEMSVSLREGKQQAVTA